MGVIKNIYAGDNIYVENIGSDSVRINGSFDSVKRDIHLPTYFDLRYEQSKIDEGDKRYYVNIYNQILRINGKYYKLPDKKNLSINKWTVYDLTLQIADLSMEKDLKFFFSAYQRSSDEIIFPEKSNIFLLFRLYLDGDYLEVKKIIPEFWDLEICQMGFMSYYGYEQKVVKSAKGLPFQEGCLAFPTMGVLGERLLVTMPTSADATVNKERYVTYSGSDKIGLGPEVE